MELGFTYRKEIIKELNILLKDKEGLIFFICTPNYQKYLNPLYSSLNIFASNWQKLLIKVGYEKYKDLKELNFDPIMYIDINKETFKDKCFDIKSFSANIRAPLINLFCENLMINKIIYLDIDTLLVRDLNCSIRNFPSNKKFFLRSVSKPFFKFSNKSYNYMPLKSGVIFIKTDDYQFLGDDTTILDFTKSYQSKCWSSKNNWFSDQKGLLDAFENKKKLQRFLFTSYRICDWYFLPSSIFWAAKGSIKEEIIWKINCFFIEILHKEISKLKKKFLNKFFILFYKKFLRLLFLILFPINYCYLILRFFISKIRI